MLTHIELLKSILGKPIYVTADEGGCFTITNLAIEDKSNYTIISRIIEVGTDMIKVESEFQDGDKYYDYYLISAIGAIKEFKKS